VRNLKFIHAADLHLDSPLRGLSQYPGAPVKELRGATRRSLENLVSLAKDEKVAFVLIAGDVYDGDWKDYNTGLFFLNQMSILREAGIQVYLIKGNHDAKSQITRSLTLPSNVHDFSTSHPETKYLPEHAVAIHGQGFQNQSVSEDISSRYPAAIPGCFNIGLLHTSATGRPGHENYAPCTLEGLLSKGYDYWALGHVHHREVISTDPYIVFPGNTQGRHIRETDSKGCTLVEVIDGKITSVEHKPLDVLQWLHCTIDANCSSTVADLIDIVCKHIEHEIADLDELRLVALRIRITGTFGAHREVFDNPAEFENEIRQALNDFGGGRLWLEKLSIRTRAAIDLEEVVLRDDPMGHLLQFVRAVPQDSELLAELMDDFRDLRLRLPQELATGQDPVLRDDQSFITDLLPDVENDLVATLFAHEEAR